MGGRLEENQMPNRVTSTAQKPPEIIALAYDGVYEGVRKLVFDCVNIPEMIGLLSQTDPRTGMTALHVATGNNDLPMTRLLVEAGAGFVPDKAGRMPSTMAELMEVDDELLDLLVEREGEVADRAAQ